MRPIRDITVLHNIPVVVRAALNVPVEGGVIENEYRLRRAVPTLRSLADQGARVVVISHLGEKGTETLREVAAALGRLTNGISFFPETIGANVRNAIRDLLPGKILVLENLRRNRGEVMNDKEFAKELAQLGDIFVEDSFDTCHRKHASLVTLPKLLPSYAGLLLEEEITALSRALAPEHPALAVIGGAKFSTKEPVLTTLLGEYDHVFVGGALANDFLKASGREVGKSLVGDSDTRRLKEILTNSKLVLPIDVLVVPESATRSSAVRKHARVISVDEVGADDIILDHGPATTTLLEALVQKSKNILWNGPVGNYENGFTDATDALARAIAASNAHSVVGGGDTIASIEKLGLFSKFSFVSTGGGAMLDFLAHGTLPGIEALG